MEPTEDSNLSQVLVLRALRDRTALQHPDLPDWLVWLEAHGYIRYDGGLWHNTSAGLAVLKGDDEQG